MKAYHGGKIESYVLGYIDKAKIIDISSAYPYALSLLPKLTGKFKKFYGKNGLEQVLNDYYYLFIKCDVYIDDPEFIHPLIVRSPINISNLSPYGYIKDVIITKPEYLYLLENGIEVEVKDGYAVESVKEYPYKNLVNFLFESRLKNKDNPSLADLFKTIINSLYGITYELNDIYEENEKDEIEWVGYRAGDFNPVIC